MSDAAPDAGLFASLRRMLATLTALLQTRLELISVEVEEQVQRAASVLLWSIAAIFFAAQAVLLLAFTIVIAFWDGHRLLAAGLVTGSFMLAALAAALVVRHRVRARPRLLAESAAALARDAAALARDTE